MIFGHIPVLLHEATSSLLQGLELHQKSDCFIIDTTLGGAGHTKALVEAIFLQNSKIHLELLSFDQDALAVAASKIKLLALQQLHPSFEFRIINENFRSLQAYVPAGKSVDILLSDLGLSSPQLDDFQRGFSVGAQAAPDMRMDPRATQTATTLLTLLPEPDLAAIFRDYGEEPKAKKLAAAIVAARTAGELPLDDASVLAKFFETALGYGYSRRSPAIRIFQALRIAVNDELGALQDLLEAIPRVMNPQTGRAGIISFHSLEDRMAKQAMRRWEEAQPSMGCEFPRGGVVPTDTEASHNPRTRSARLRVFYFGETRQSARKRTKQVGL